ncbi:MAG: zeta toxin family protein [Methylococcales bacterium]
MNTQKKTTCWIIAGHNGAGKTTFALNYLPQVAQCSAFVNADLIAAGLSPLAPEKELLTASRLFLKEVEQYIKAGADFSFETTLSGRGYLQLINRLKRTGWRVELIYLALPSAEMSKMRVLERVAHGGHNIPVSAIERRFPRSLHNLLTEYSYLAHQTHCFMNDGVSPELIFVQQETHREIINEPLFNHLLQQANL